MRFSHPACLLLGACLLLNLGAALADEPDLDAALAELDKVAADLKTDVDLKALQAAVDALPDGNTDTIQCELALNDMDATPLLQDDDDWCDNEREIFCERLKEPQDFLAAMDSAAGIDGASRACGRPQVVLTKQVCARALEQGFFPLVSRTCPDQQAGACMAAERLLAGNDLVYETETAEFLRERCGDRYATLAKQHCAGRDYTAIRDRPYQALCLDWAASRLSR